ncbi:FAD-dependent oxidoreductase [Micromonospora cremea]|uniref:3-(3-hydroxy-phenyl)propionate hydroxylase n=1 Tax=Micromonospora cremea TaxID=709881 RepID=A0A1N5UER5_9ACTN|nr:NAD(P)/FAD-dependent oxidoreductase [Micromonospora cremea]SIM59146.1 3-(3-hydroxy-phenyl)propionate hydroxylase [Micromonospora cremea]
MGHVIVVGGGPVGVVAALAAARSGFEVTVLEAAEQVQDDPRASTLHPSTLEMLDDLGLVDELISVGLVARHFDFWDKPSRSLVARLDHDVLRHETRFPFVVQTEQHKLARIGLHRLAEMPNVEVRLGCTFTSLEQSADSVVVHAQTADGPVRLTGDWVIGCDGGRSAVRKGLGIEFEGYTWPERFVVLTSLFDFADAMSCSYRSYFADPSEWSNLFKVAGEDLKGRWRVVLPTSVGESDEQALSDEASMQRLERICPGASQGEIVHRKIYRVHQRVAAQFRVGRAFLAGDAAHVNNPIGGLGLNCGIHDAVELLEALDDFRGSRNEDVLDAYERRRRDLNIRYVQQQTVSNKKRLEEKDPVVRAQRLDELRAIASSEESQRVFLRRTSLLESVREPHASA